MVGASSARCILEEVASGLAIRQGRFGERDVGGEARRLLVAGQGCQVDNYEAGWLTGRIPSLYRVAWAVRAARRQIRMSE